jgi:hypothetical protein
MPTNNTKRLLIKLKLLQVELRQWAQAKFKGQASQVAISKWVIQTPNRVEEHRDLNAIEISLCIRLKVHIRNLTSILETKWQQRASARWIKLGDNNMVYFLFNSIISTKGELYCSAIEPNERRQPPK